MTGLVDKRRGRKGPIKLTEEVMNFLDNLGPCSAAEAARPRGVHRGLAAPPEHPTGPPTVGRFWPVGEPAQANYERLRAAVVSGRGLPDELASARFVRRGLAGLISWPAAKPVFAAVVTGASRPAWTPYADPRLEALAVTYQLLLAEAGPGPQTALTAFPAGQP